MRTRAITYEELERAVLKILHLSTHDWELDIPVDVDNDGMIEITLFEKGNIE